MPTEKWNNGDVILSYAKNSYKGFWEEAGQKKLDLGHEYLQLLLQKEKH